MCFAVIHKTVQPTAPLFNPAGVLKVLEGIVHALAFDACSFSNPCRIHLILVPKDIQHLSLIAFGVKVLVHHVCCMCSHRYHFNVQYAPPAIVTFAVHYFGALHRNG